MSNINLVMGSKGGIGKSLIAYMLAQYLMENKGAILGFDTDFHNTTFANYPTLGAQPLNLVDKETEEVQTGALDLIGEASLENPDVDLVIDVGASSFLAFFKYLLDMELVANWGEMGYKVVFHIIIAGGDNYLDTLQTFTMLMERGLKDRAAKCVAWANSFLGQLENKGTGFVDSDEFRKFNKRVSAIVAPPRLDPLFRSTLVKICSERLLLDEVKDSTKFMAMEKMRVASIKKKWWEAMSVADSVIL